VQVPRPSFTSQLDHPRINHQHIAVNFISHTSPPVAWHRVISTSGVISTHGPNPQQHLLEVEGVEVHVGIAGETRVTVDRWGWSPEMGDLKLGMKMGAEETEWGA
jgi:methylated-DNA-protein-cysteine methyltransferase-like protein